MATMHGKVRIFFKTCRHDSNLILSALHRYTMLQSECHLGYHRKVPGLQCIQAYLEENALSLDGCEISSKDVSTNSKTNFRFLKVTTEKKASGFDG